MSFLLFDQNRTTLLPFTFTRPVAEIRFGILTIREKWEKFLNQKTSFLTENYLQKKFPAIIREKNILINGSICPDDILVKEISKLRKGEKLIYNNVLIGAVISGEEVNRILSGSSADKETMIFETMDKFSSVLSKTKNILQMKFPYDIFHKNGETIISDYKLITQGRKSKKAGRINCLLGKDIFIEEGVKIQCAALNSQTGPVYLGKNSEVMEGSIIRGPFALCNHAVLKLSSKIYGPTTIGPFSKAGGEINNSVISGYSNKAHDGFMGNSVIGEWCNIGADTNTSNLKNTYADVEVWNYGENKFLPSGLQFCGLFMGDHSKCGINTMFNTGTVVGVCANIFGSGFPRKFIPDFSWGGAHGFQVYEPDKAFEVAQEVYKRRDKGFDDTEKEILIRVFEITKQYRSNFR
ncbi:MAG: glucose-1-phosphate thymidylyltransferase [Bacteroidetes bacterium]|nr:glucose-1-phosphate thymidylyltransferase [Bacteroidota bacterium]